MSLSTLFSVRTESGFTVSHVEYRNECSSEMSFQESSPSIGYGYCLSGDMVCTASGVVDHVRRDESGLWKRTSDPVHFRMAKGTHSWIEVSLPQNFAERFFQENTIRLTSRAHDLFLKHTQPASMRHAPTTRVSHMIRQILLCPFEGCMRESYLVNKGMELVLEELDALCLQKEDKNAATHARQVADAVHILLHTLDQTISIRDLAHRVGLSETTLKRSFKKVHGLSVFAFFQRHRMEQARQMLLKKRMNVAEVAYALGYSAPEHFSRAFRLHYGYPPKMVR